MRNHYKKKKNLPTFLKIGTENDFFMQVLWYIRFCIILEIFEGEYVLILKFYSRQKVKESTILVSMLMGNIFFFINNIRIKLTNGCL